MTTLGHEPPAIWSGSIFVSGAILLATVMAAQVAGLWIFNEFAVANYTVAAFPLDPQTRSDVPAAPRLEGIERRQGEYAGVHADDLRPARQPALQKTTWVDRQAGIVQIPIEQAMKILVETQKLPERAAEKR